MTALADASTLTPWAAAGPVILTVNCELTTANRHELRAVIQSALDRNVKHVILDLSGAGHVDTAAIGMLVSVSKRARELGGELVLRGLVDDLREAFARSKIDQVLSIEPREVGA